MVRKSPKKRNRRPEKFTPECQAAILKDISAGVPQKYAAQRAGVSDRTLRDWLTKGSRAGSAKSDQPYGAFFAAYKKAEADAVAVRLGNITYAGLPHDDVTVRETTELDPLTGKLVVTKRIVTTRRVFEWQALAWLLERTHQKDFCVNRGKLKEPTATAKAQGPLVVRGEADPDKL